MDTSDYSGGKLGDSRVPCQKSKEGGKVVLPRRGMDETACSSLPEQINEAVDQFVGSIGAESVAGATIFGEKCLKHRDSSCVGESDHFLPREPNFVNKNHEIAWRCAAAGLPIAPYTATAETPHETPAEWVERRWGHLKLVH